MRFENDKLQREKKEVYLFMAYSVKIIVPTIKTRDVYEKSDAYKCLILSTQPLSTVHKSTQYEIHILTENKKGFCQLYNEYITDKEDEYTVFMHDDLEIHDLLFFSKIVDAHRRFDIVGIAGAASQNYTNAKTPAWHLCMNKREDGRGFLSHLIPKDIGGFPFPYINSSYFGPTPAPAVFVDGVFISFKGKSVREKEVKFNEKYTFHHYDMSACAEAIQKGLTIGVYPIFGIHHGLGEFQNDPLWYKLAKEFLIDYRDYNKSI